MSKRVFIVLIILSSILLSSCKVGKIKHEYESKRLPKVPEQTLLDNALLVLQDDSIMNSFSFVNWNKTENFEREILCFYKGEVGYIREYGLKNGADDYTIEYYKEGYLYSSWYYHMFGDEYDCIKEKREYIIDVELHKEKAHENYNLILSMLSLGGNYINDININGKTYYVMHTSVGHNTEYDELNLYFDKDRKFVGCELFRFPDNKTDSYLYFNINTFNSVDGTPIGKEFNDVFDWMNYPTDLDETE